MTEFTANSFYETLKATETAHHEQALAACRELARTHYRDIIYPWWSAFVGSQVALDLAVRLPDHPRNEIRLTSNLSLDRRQTKDGLYIALGGDVRSLHAVVRYHIEGGPRSMAGSMRVATGHTLPLTHPELPADFDLHPARVHPLVLVDFAEQIQAGIVDAYIRRHLRG